MRFVCRSMLAIHLALSAFSTTAQAQEKISIPSGESWSHPHNGIVVPEELGGLLRVGASAFAEDFLDVGISFSDYANNEVLTLYIFRNTNGNVPIWFEQARQSIESRPGYDFKLAAGPTPFTPFEQTNASGLMAVYAPEGGSQQYRSSGIALFAVDGWYVKLRASSQSRTPDQMSKWFPQILKQMELPTAEMEAVVPIADCPAKLQFRKKSKDVRSDGASVLLGATLGALLAEAVEGSEGNSQPVVWCRDRVLSPRQSVYRANASTDSYLLALGDNGVGAIVAPDQASGLLDKAEGGNRGNFTITLKTAAMGTNYISQNRLPSPERVMQIIDDNQVVATFSTWGDDQTMTINADAM